MKPVRIYTTEHCGYCARAKEFLRGRNVSYEEVDVSNDDAERDRLVERSGGQRTVPQIFIGEVHVGGYSDLMRLQAEGTLDTLLA